MWGERPHPFSTPYAKSAAAELRWEDGRAGSHSPCHTPPWDLVCHFSDADDSGVPWERGENSAHEGLDATGNTATQIREEEEVRGE